MLWNMVEWSPVGLFDWLLALFHHVMVCVNLLLSIFLRIHFFSFKYQKYINLSSTLHYSERASELAYVDGTHGRIQKKTHRIAVLTATTTTHCVCVCACSIAQAHWTTTATRVTVRFRSGILNSRIFRGKNANAISLATYAWNQQIIVDHPLQLLSVAVVIIIILAAKRKPTKPNFRWYYRESMQNYMYVAMKCLFSRLTT